MPRSGISSHIAANDSDVDDDTLCSYDVNQSEESLIPAPPTPRSTRSRVARNLETIIPIQERTSSEPWYPYENSAGESPVLQHLESCMGILRACSMFYMLRSSIRYPLQYKMPGGIVTVGEILLVLPVLIFLGLSTGSSGDDVEDTGSAPQYALALTISTATHNSIWTFLLGIPFERGLQYHKLFALVTVILGAYHGYIGYTHKGKTRDVPGTDEYLTGFVFEVAMASMVVFSFGPLRRRFFNLFYFTHIAGFLVVIAFGVLHEGILGPGVGLWVIDLAVRYVYMAAITNPNKAEITLLPGNVVRIQFRKPANFNYKGGQYMFICIPQVSLWQWHPFSISSSPHDDTILLHVRALGNWTRHLTKLAAQSTQQVTVLTEGPYGTTSVDIEGDRYKCFVLISGGIGITPMMSISNELIEQAQRGRPLKKLHFVWAVREKEMVTSMGMEKQHTQAHGPLQSSQRQQQQHHHQQQQQHHQVLPSVFQPQLVSPQSTNTINTEFYLSEPQSQASEQTEEELAEFSDFLHIHRPNLHDIVQRAVQSAVDVGENNVAVLFCGPARMGAALQAECRKIKNVRMDLHKETFEF